MTRAAKTFFRAAAATTQPASPGGGLGDALRAYPNPSNGKPQVQLPAGSYTVKLVTSERTETVQIDRK